MSGGAGRTESRIDSFLAGYLRLDATEPEADIHDIAVQRVVERTCYHGLQGLIVDDPRFASDVPAVHEALFRLAAADAVQEVVHHEVLNEVCEAFAASGVDALFLKGTALAYLVYDKPAHRPRRDSDMIIPKNQTEPAMAALEGLGFKPVSVSPLHYQRPYLLERSGFMIDIDLHWRAANSEVVSRAFEFPGLAHGQQALPRLHPVARAPSTEDLLAFAIMHLLFDRQYLTGDPLTWLLDLQRLGMRLDTAGWQRFVERQISAGMAGATLTAFSHAETQLGAFVPKSVKAQFRDAPEGDLSRFLAGSKFRQMRQEVFVRRPVEAMQYVSGVVFPGGERLETKYGAVPRWQYPFYYARRAVGGIFKARRLSRK